MPLERVSFIAQDFVDEGDEIRLVFGVHWEDTYASAEVEAVSAEIAEEFFGDPRIKLDPSKNDETTRLAYEELDRQLRSRNPELEFSYGETFETVDEALDWARRHATRVLVRIGLSSEWSAGVDPLEDLPTWPPPADEIEARSAELRDWAMTRRDP